MTGASLTDRLAEALATNGAGLLFGLPGGGPNLDMIGAAAARGIDFVLAHGENEAAIMASTYGLLTGAPAAVVVTRGPGAASVANGLSQATLDRYPLVVITDTVPAASARRVAHQRLDQRSLLAPTAKVSATVSDQTTSERLAELVSTACRWPLGGIHLDFDPTAGDVGAAARAAWGPPADGAEPALETASWLLSAARRPLIIVGMEAAVIAHRGQAGAPSEPGSGPTSPLGTAIEGFGCPVLTTYQAIGVVPTEGPVSAGLFTNGALERPVLDAADLIITIGLDPVEPIPAPWSHTAPVIRVSSVADSERYLPATVDLVGDVPTIVDSLGARVPTPRPWAWAPGEAAEFRQAARHRLVPPAGGGSFGPLELVAVVAAAVADDSTVTVDAGAHFLAVMPNWPVSRPFDLLISNGLATMGFAVPAAIGAALARPGRPVVALTGDGGLAMALAELETIGRLGLPITVVVFNDNALSLIEIKQRPGQGGSGAVRYDPVDFAAIAVASGIDGVIVEGVDELAAAIDGQNRPRLIDARIDPADYRHLIAATRG